MWEELQNALAWHTAAPSRWLASAQQDLSAAAEWIWVVLQGDFAEDQTTAQTVTGTVISMIPFVDQVCDVRDIVANCKKINQDTSNKWAWFALLLTLIGLIPTLGSLVKGCFKILFAYGRKAMASSSKAALDADLWKATSPYVEAGVRKLNDYLSRPEVRKTLSALRIDNPYKYLADKLRELKGQVNVAVLLRAFDDALKVLNQLLDLVNKWGSAALQTRVGQLLQSVKAVRDKADAQLGALVAPAQNWLNRLAQRLDVEHRLNYQASTNAVNPHNFTRFSLDAEVLALKKAPPSWVQVGKAGEFPELKKAPVAPNGHFDIGDAGDKLAGLKNAHKTFNTVRPDVLPPGTVIYRVVAPNSLDNSICWMTKAEFDKLRSKPEWRDRFAVWRHWNSNGEFLTYTVPPGEGLKVWRGTTASQVLKDRNERVIPANEQGDGYWLQGGAEQLVVHPQHLQRELLGQRQFTGWGYDEGDIQVNLVGVPILQNNWRDAQ